MKSVVFQFYSTTKSCLFMSPIIVDIHPNPYSYFVEVTFHLKNYHLLIAIERTWTLTFPKLPALYVKLHIENVAIT